MAKFALPPQCGSKACSCKNKRGKYRTCISDSLPCFVQLPGLLLLCLPPEKCDSCLHDFSGSSTECRENCHCWDFVFGTRVSKGLVLLQFRALFLQVLHSFCLSWQSQGRCPKSLGNREAILFLSFKPLHISYNEHRYGGINSRDQNRNLVQLPVDRFMICYVFERRSYR